MVFARVFWTRFWSIRRVLGWSKIKSIRFYWGNRECGMWDRFVLFFIVMCEVK